MFRQPNHIQNISAFHISVIFILHEKRLGNFYLLLYNKLIIYLLTPIVIQSEAKNLEGIHMDALVYATEILPPFGRLNDK